MERIICGVPLLLYINDISESTPESTLAFADDTSIYMSHSDIPVLFMNAKMSINTVFYWFCADKLSLNPTKTKCLAMHAPHK